MGGDGASRAVERRLASARTMILFVLPLPGAADSNRA
jgi:hypothetical protein